MYMDGLALDCNNSRAPSQYKDRLIYVWCFTYAISMLKIRRPLGRLIFNMAIAIPGKTVFLIETALSMLAKMIPVFHKATNIFWR